MLAALPRPEYYGGSVPPAPSAGVAPIRRPFPWPGNSCGTHAGSSHVHLPCGRRVRHPALPLRPRHDYAV